MKDLQAYTMGLGFSEQSAGGIYVPDETFAFSPSRGIHVDESRLTVYDKIRRSPILGSLGVLAGAVAVGVAALGGGKAHAIPLASHCLDLTSTPGFNNEGEHHVTAGAYFSSESGGLQPKELGLGVAVSYDQIHPIGDDCLPYRGAQLSLQSGMHLDDGSTPFLVASGAIPRLLWDWLRITTAVQAEKGSYTAAKFGTEITLADVAPLDFRGGGIISHNTSPEGRTPNGGYVGARLRLPFLTLDGEGDFTNPRFNVRGFLAGIVDGYYLAAGGDSLDQMMQASVGVENPDGFGFLVEGGFNLLERVQEAKVLLTTSSQFGRTEYDERMARGVGNNASQVIGRGTGYGFPQDVVGIPLASPAGRFGRDENIRDLIGLPTSDFALVLGFRNDAPDTSFSYRHPLAGSTDRTDVEFMLFYTLPDEVGGIATDGITVGLGGDYADVRDTPSRRNQGTVNLELLIPFIRPGKDFALSISGRGFIDPSFPRNGGGTVLLDGRFR
ncbi:hypothetical protein HYT52_01215 [Candidatus Woesearchaeota archaeon]|nr:hypothetical protein [Candidatus Woesearchaeota archaeon]